MPSLLDTVIGLWPIVSQIAPLLFGVAIIYLRSQFPHKTDFAALAQTVTTLSEKLSANSTSVEHLAKDQVSSPNRIELMSRIAALEGRVSGVESGLQGIRHQLDTANDYLKILVDRGLDR
jgi:hypothetical protein